MKSSALWQVSIRTRPEGEAAVCALFESVLGSAASAYVDERTRVSVVSVYLDRRSAFNRVRRRALETGLRALEADDVGAGSGRIRIQRLAREDWAESWKRHFKPIEFGRRLLLKPSWSRRRPRAGQVAVVLDPGMSFGTGQHPTTAFCLEQLVARRRAGTGQAMLDVGTGSGIVAIAAAKLGYRPIRAFDFDPEAVRAARGNTVRNRVTRHVVIEARDLTRLPHRSPQRFDFICANLISTLLISERHRIVARLQPGGALVLAGILRGEFSNVRRAYEASGLRLEFSKTANGWRSGLFLS